MLLEVPTGEVETVSETVRVRTIGLLLDGAINFIHMSRAEFQSGNIENKDMYIGKSALIVEHLSEVINLDGGSVAVNLKYLYSFVLERLNDALLIADDMAYEAESILVTIRDSWNEMSKATVCAEPCAI